MRILLVDDDKTILFTVGSLIRQLGHEVRKADSANEALIYMAKEDFSLVLTDIKMSGMSGIDLSNEIQGLPLEKRPKVVLFTGHNDLEFAIEAIRAGVYDYLLKPIKVDDLARIINKIEESGETADDEKRGASTFLNPLESQHKVYIHSDAMARAVVQAKKYHTDRSIPVLIEGETGTGKEVIAKIIHGNSAHNKRPFIAVNCAAIPSSLFESELFGYETGAFTGGSPKGKKGMIEAAAGGTLLLDEIGELPVNLQVKLLRVLQEKEYYRIGGVGKMNADVRIICATNADLSAKMQDGKFRKDLYYRLRGGIIRLAPLRENRKAIIPLACYFLRNTTEQRGKLFRNISKAAADELLKYDWPGNVRELKNVIELAVFMHNDVLLQPGHLSHLLEDNTTTTSGGKCGVKNNSFLGLDNLMLPNDEFPLDDFVHKVVAKAIAMHNGNKAAAARYLKISRRELYGRFKGVK